MEMDKLLIILLGIITFLAAVQTIQLTTLVQAISSGISISSNSVFSQLPAQVGGCA